MTKSITDSSKHVPNQAAPLTPQDIRAISRYIDCLPSVPLAVKPAILVAYSCFLRVSNVLAPSVSSWGGRHTILAKDIIDVGDRLYAVIRSTKTRRSGEPHVLTILRNSNINVCPVASWRAYIRHINPCPLGPAFMVDTGTPLTPGLVVPIIRAALARTSALDPKSFSFHSLRRGAAQAASNAGASQQAIMHHGTWRSNTGVSHYLKPKPHMVPAIIADTLAQ